MRQYLQKICAIQLSNSRLKVCVVDLLFVACIGLASWIGIGDVSGFFCDEAMMGLAAHGLGTSESLYIAPFFYRHFQSVHGLFHVATLKPLVSIFGMYEEVVRLSGFLYMLLLIYGYVLIFRVLKYTHVYICALVVWLTPIFFHHTRMNMGHPASLWLSIMGLYVYARALQRSTHWRYVIVGMLIGLSAYANLSFYLHAPLLSLTLAGIHIVHQRYTRLAWKASILMCLGCLIVYSGVIHVMVTQKDFFQRYEDKKKVASQTIIETISQYPKYLSPTYLFLSGENGSRTARIIRNSVSGAGVLYLFQAGALVVALITLKKTGRATHPLLFFALIYTLVTPLPDLLTTSSALPPYTLSLAPYTISLLLLVSSGMDMVMRSGLRAWRTQRLSHRLIVAVGVIFVCGEILRYLILSLLYPMYASGYWGWQWGPREIAREFLLREKEYDRMFLDPTFNEPKTLLAFYRHESPCTKCSVGMPGYVIEDPAKRYLYVVREETYRELSDKARYQTIHILSYPNGEVAFRFLTHKESTHPSSVPVLEGVN